MELRCKQIGDQLYPELELPEQTVPTPSWHRGRKKKDDRDER